MFAKLFELLKPRAKVLPPPLAELDFGLMEAAFTTIFDVRLSRSETKIVLRPRNSGSYREPHPLAIERFTRDYLKGIGRTHLWSRSLCEEFEAFVRAGAPNLEEGQIVKGHSDGGNWTRAAR
jgi:hypothetical protein